MSNIDSDKDTTVQTTYNPDGSTTRTVATAPSRTGYWVAALVAVVAVIAVAFMVFSQNNKSVDANAAQAAVDNAYQQGQTQAQIDAAGQVAAAQQSAATQAATAQAQAQVQAQATQAALAQSADAANRAAARAQRAADRAQTTTPDDTSPQ